MYLSSLSNTNTTLNHCLSLSLHQKGVFYFPGAQIIYIPKFLFYHFLSIKLGSLIQVHLSEKGITIACDSLLYNFNF